MDEMNVNKTLLHSNLTSEIYPNISLDNKIDYHLNENELLISADEDFPTSFTKTFGVLSELVLNETFSANLFDYGNTLSNATLFPYVNETEFRGFIPSFENNLLIFILCFFCFVTVFGNVLVLAAVIKEPYLHTVTNYFIASLATADFIVGICVMPFCVILEVTNGYWPFGPDWCDIWRSIDVLASTASILNLCVISLDRYWAITDSMNYPNKITPKVAAVLIAGVWVLSALISFPAIAWWRTVADGPPPEDQCLFTNDLGYLLFSSIVSFYGPLAIMLYFYWKIYQAAQIQNKSLKIGTKKVHANGGKCESLTLRIHRGGMLSPNLDSNLANGNHRNNNLQENTPLRAPQRHAKSLSISRRISKLAKEKKAAKTLGIVMGVFILCWLPFFICNVLIGFYGVSYFENPKLVLSVVTWLGWTNSGMNPIIYALWSREFRRAFTKLLCIYCPKYIQRKHTYRKRFRHLMRDDFTYPHLRSANHPPVIQDINL